MKWTVVGLGLLLTGVVLMPTASAENWPGWRGPRGDGTSVSTKVPISWDATIGKNLLWKTPLKAEGHASPIVHGNRVYIVGCLKASQERALVCLDAHSGKIIWSKVVVTSALETKHRLNSFASGTPVTDGKVVYA
ncbi:MAG: PQQ-binding-like beta-propeller repeat protein, partial [Planctomycetaceae bacterium]